MISYRQTILVSLLILVLCITSFPTNTTATEGTPDYEFEFVLPADGSKDVGTEYAIIRNNTGEAGKISMQAYKSNLTVLIQLENIDKVTIYFNATDVDIEEYQSFIKLRGAEVTIVLTSDGESLDGEFHGLPQPDAVYLDGVDWGDYSFEDGNFIFEGLETSTRTFTLEYFSSVISLMYNAVMIFWTLSFLIIIFQMILGIPDAV